MRDSWIANRLKCVIGAMLLYCASCALCAASTCRPGVNWVGSCAAGTETLSVTEVFGFDTDLDAFNTADVMGQFVGMMTVTRSAPYASSGSGNAGYLDRIDMELVSMSLAGASPYVAGWKMRAGVNEGLAPTTGYISELGDPQAPTARYDMVFEFENTPLGTLHHNGSLFFSTQIDQSPAAGAVYKHTGCCFGTLFDLFDGNNINVPLLTDQFGTDYAEAGRPELTITGIVPLPATVWLLSRGLLGIALRAKGHAC